MDDDDIIPIDFMRITNQEANNCRLEYAILDWPLGYVQLNNQLHYFINRSNQFITFLNNEGKDPHCDNHRSLGEIYPLVSTSESTGWVWFRHSTALTGTPSSKSLDGRADCPNRHRWSVVLP